MGDNWHRQIALGSHYSEDPLEVAWPIPESLVVGPKLGRPLYSVLVLCISSATDKETEVSTS